MQQKWLALEKTPPTPAAIAAAAEATTAAAAVALAAGKPAPAPVAPFSEPRVIRKVCGRAGHVCFTAQKSSVKTNPEFVCGRWLGDPMCLLAVCSCSGVLSLPSVMTHQSSFNPASTGILVICQL